MGLTPFSRFQTTNGIIEKTVNFAGTNLSASGTIVLVSDLFSACLSDAVQINEVHLFAKTALNGSNGSNLDVTRRYGTDPASASDVTIFTSAGAIACDAAANVTQVFSKTSGTKLIDGAHPEDGSLSVVTLDDALAFLLKKLGVSLNSKETSFNLSFLIFFISCSSSTPLVLLLSI